MGNPFEEFGRADETKVAEAAKAIEVFLDQEAESKFFTQFTNNRKLDQVALLEAIHRKKEELEALAKASGGDEMMRATSAEDILENDTMLAKKRERLESLEAALGGR